MLSFLKILVRPFFHNLESRLREPHYISNLSSNLFLAILVQWELVNDILIFETIFPFLFFSQIMKPPINWWRFEWLALKSILIVVVNLNSTRAGSLLAPATLADQIRLAILKRYSNSMKQTKLATSNFEAFFGHPVAGNHCVAQLKRQHFICLKVSKFRHKFFTWDN